MAEDATASAIRRIGRWCTRGRVASCVALAGGATIVVFAIASAGGASGSPRALGEPPRSGVERSGASTPGSPGSAPSLTHAEATTLAAIERYVEIAARPTSTVVPASPTQAPPTNTPQPVPTPRRPLAVQVPPTVPVPASTPVPPNVPAPTSTPAPPPPPRASGLDTSPMDAYAQALFDDTNRRRASQNMPPLRANPELVGIARIRSRDMADHNYFAHVSPVTGDNAFTLMDKYGVPYGWAGENLAKNNYPIAETEGVADVALWNSAPHRENILNPHYTDMGIALVVDPSGMNYFTIIFTGPA